MNFIPKTIRGQIMMAFLVCFVFMAIIIALNYNNFNRLSESMQFFELAEDLNSTILEMRRYEKNYFLYRQEFNYEENVTYTNQLALTLQRERDYLIRAIGRDNYGQFIKYVQDYSDLMARLRRASCDSSGCPDLQALIRGAGQNLLTLADHLVVSERRIIDRLLRQMIPLPLISLILLVVLLGFVIFFIGEKVIVFPVISSLRPRNILIYLKSNWFAQFTTRHPYWTGLRMAKKGTSLIFVPRC